MFVNYGCRCRTFQMYLACYTKGGGAEPLQNPYPPRSWKCLVYLWVRVHLCASVRHSVVGDSHRDHSDICDRVPLEELRDMSQPLATVAGPGWQAHTHRLALMQQQLIQQLKKKAPKQWAERWRGRKRGKPRGKGARKLGRQREINIKFQWCISKKYMSNTPKQTLDLIQRGSLTAWRAAEGGEVKCTRQADYRAEVKGLQGLLRAILKFSPCFNYCFPQKTQEEFSISSQQQPTRSAHD